MMKLIKNSSETYSFNISVSLT